MLAVDELMPTVARLLHLKSRLSTAPCRWRPRRQQLNVYEGRDGRAHGLLQVAAMLNGQPMGGKRRSAYHFDLWCLKYLPKFQWEALTEDIGECVCESLVVICAATRSKYKVLLVLQAERHS